jgi:tetratricopeptide (TPR) repeat protein
MFAREADQALEAAERELRVSQEFQLPLLSGQAAFQIGWSQFWIGDRQDGLDGMDKALLSIRETGAEMGLPYLMALFAEALADCERLDEAFKTIDAALDLGRANGTYFQLSEVLRISAGIRERRGAGRAEIESLLHQAADVAALQHSAIGQLRAKVELARRFRKHGDANKARDLLASQLDLVGRLGDAPDARAVHQLL